MIAIIGNGLTGLTLAHICKIKGWEYQLIAPTKPQSSPKKIILNTRSMNFLKKLNILYEHETTPYHQIKIMQRNCIPQINLHKDQYHLPAIAYGICQSKLIEKLSTDTSYQMITHGSADKHQVILGSENGTQNFSYVFGCDGQNSIIKHIPRINTRYSKPSNCCIIPAHIESHTLIQRFSRSVTGAVLPGNPGMIALSSSEDLKSWLFSENDITAFFKGHVDISLSGKPIYYKVTPSITDACYKDRCMLLGNASLNISPIAAQSFNNTLRHLQDLFNIDKLSPSCLEKAAIKIQQRNQNLYTHMHYITSNHYLTPLLRAAGIAACGFLTPLQDQIMKFGNRDA